MNTIILQKELREELCNTPPEAGWHDEHIVHFIELNRYFDQTRLCPRPML